MPKTVVFDLVDLVTDKESADPTKPEAYIGLEHIPERAIIIDKAGSTENIRGMCVRFVEGDILFGKLRPNLRKSVLAPIAGLGSTEILVLRPKPGVDPAFAGHVLRSENVFFNAAKMTEGTRMPRTSWKVLSKIEVFAPRDRDTQRLIAEILDAMDDAVIQTAALIEKLTNLRLSLIEDLCGEEALAREASKNSTGFKKFENGSLGKWLSNIEQGWSPDCEDEPTPGGLWGVLKTTSVVWSGWDDTQNKRLPAEMVARPRLEVRAGDVLMTRAGPDHRVGVVAYVCDTQEKLMLSDKLYRLILQPDFLPDFLALVLSSSGLQKQISSFKVGMAQSQMNITQANVKKLRVFRPPPEYQTEAVRRISVVDGHLDSERSRRDKLLSLRLALRDELLSGRKRVLISREAAV